MLRYPFSLIATWLKLATNFLRLLNNPKKEKKLKPSLFQCSPDRTITNFLFLFLSEMQLAEWWRLVKGWRHCNRCSFKDNILSDSFFAFTFTYIYIYIYMVGLPGGSDSKVSNCLQTYTLFLLIASCP